MTWLDSFVELLIKYDMTYLVFHIILSTVSTIITIVRTRYEYYSWSDLFGMIMLSIFIPYIVLLLYGFGYLIDKYIFLREKKSKEKRKKEQLHLTDEIMKEQNEVLYVNYQCFFPENTENYPIVKIPKENYPIKTHCFGKKKRRGYKEDSFQLSIQKYFGDDFIILGDVYLNIGKESRPFEPDIAIINKRKTYQNIRIDIEIDEPYSGKSRQPTHYKGKDCIRDIYFSKRGWIVVRFSEYQVHTQELSCLRFLAYVIKSIFRNYLIPPELFSAVKLIRDDLWDIVQAQIWEKEKYREKYLGINEFGNVPINIETVGQDLTEREREEERLVKPTASIGCDSITTQTIKTSIPYSNKVTNTNRTWEHKTNKDRIKNSNVLNNGIIVKNQQSTDIEQPPLIQYQNHSHSKESKHSELVGCLGIILFDIGGIIIFILVIYLLSLIIM